MPRIHSSPSGCYCVVETALMSILCIVSTHSRLPFKDEASDRYEKTVIVRGHPEVSGNTFSRQIRQQLRLEKAQALINGTFAIIEKDRQGR